MRGKQGRKKRNNLGMSLIEIVIAVAIMTVAVGPILRVIVYSMQMNARAREQQHLNAAAQSVMEGLKGYDIEEIYRQFSGADTFKIHHNTAGVAVVSPNPATDPCVVAGEFKPAANNSYEFTLTDMNVDGKVYDARVLMKPMTDTSGTPVTWTIADTENINPYTDAVFRRDYSLDVTDYEKIQETIVYLLTEVMKLRAVDPSKPFEEYVEPTVMNLDFSKISIDEKITTVTMKSGGVTIGWEYSISLDEEYKLVRLDGTEEMLGVDLTGSYSPTGQQIYSNSGTADDEAALKNVYLFYYPAYQNVTGVLKDKIVLNIDPADPPVGDVNVFLLKQRLPGYSDTSIQIYEDSYHGLSSGFEVKGNNSGIILYHNLGSNLINGTSYNENVINNKITGVTKAYSPGVGYMVSPLLEDEQKVLLYDVLVEIHEAGTGFTEDPLLTLQGSVNSK